MKILRFAAIFLIAAATTAAAHAQQNTFDIEVNGHVTGNCHYTFDKSKDGYKITSHYLNHVPPQFQEANAVTGAAPTTTTEVQQHTAYKLDANYSYAGGNVVNDNPLLTFGFTPNKQRTQMQASKMEAGNFSGEPSVITLKPGYVLFPDLDASAVQSFLYLATIHPTGDGNYFLILPQALSMTSGGASASSVTVHWTAQPDATGTLAGKPIALHHFSFGFGNKTVDIYGDATNVLMESDTSSGSTKSSLVRSGFVLDAAK